MVLLCKQKMNEINGSKPRMIQYLQGQHHHGLHNHTSNENVIDQDEHGHNIVDTGSGVNEVLNGHVSADLVDQSDDQGSLAQHVGCSENSNQLTLSFQGQVYVFDSVSPEKVQAVLLLLGGHEVPSIIPTLSVSTPNTRDLSDTPQKFNVPQRLASLIRFREKRKERNFDKKIRYTVRKEVALRMQRNKGQFTSSKSNNDDSTSAMASWDSNQSWGIDGDGSQTQDSFCRHCGINEKSTPMMRRGPEGPRTLCNACGLMWVNKGTLRDLSKTATSLGTNNLNNRSEENVNLESEELVLSVAGNANDSA